ncbi:MAG: MBL fold metallo-hydrolase [Theionarchaea archaeon]|nr:MBL fold metallo-hydrolase [Theionarchaea archaeon]MBU7038405.1 MBL fold metallo-hydrolase [Theionarchaea archaeon]
MIEIESHDDVHRISMSISFFGKQIFPINAYIINDLLIDTGAANLSKDFLDTIKEFTIQDVVNTHAHPDHTGSNSAFPFVYVHPEGADRLRCPQLEMQIQKFLYGLPEPSNPKEVPPVLKTGEYTFDVLHTPGHSPDHISLYESHKKWAFTGDLLLWGPTREVFVDVKIYDAIESLERLADLDIDILFPGHGPPFGHPKEALSKQVRTLKDFGVQVKELHERGWNAEEIRNHLFGRERMYVYLCGGKFSALNLIRSYLEG